MSLEPSLNHVSPDLQPGSYFVVQNLTDNLAADCWNLAFAYGVTPEVCLYLLDSAAIIRVACKAGLIDD